MKRLALIAILCSLAAFSVLSAQSLVDNSYYKRSVELRSMADKAFDDGDYDGAADYAAQAQEYASLSDKFVEKMLAMAAADKALSNAKAQEAKIDATLAQAAWPKEFGAAEDLLAAAQTAYQAQDFLDAKTKAEEASAAFQGLGVAMLAAYNQKLAAKADADAAIAQAKARLAWAESVNAPKTYPKDYGKAKGEMDSALASYGKEEFPAAIDHAKAVLAALASVTDTLPFPGVYVVRSIPGRSDCLWRIAEYTFIYNNPLKWPVIYEANKKTFRDPSNPNLIFPGQKLVIPALAGETREGTYDPGKTYPVYPKK